MSHFSLTDQYGNYLCIKKTARLNEVFSILNDDFNFFCRFYKPVEDVQIIICPPNDISKHTTVAWRCRMLLRGYNNNLDAFSAKCGWDIDRFFGGVKKLF